MTDVFKVADELIKHTNHEHPGKIGIIAYYGSYATGKANPSSDLDIFYVPDDIKSTRNIYHSFILEGRPFEFWPISWERLGRMASGEEHWAVSAGLLLNTKVLYSRSQEDLDRFIALKDECRDLMSPEKKSARRR